jgi:hypothetical protein
MRRVLPLIAVLLIGFAPAPFPKPNRSQEDLKKMQGSWELLYTVMNGKREYPSGKYI